MSIQEEVEFYYKKKKLYDNRLKKAKDNIKNNIDLTLEEKREKIKNIKIQCIKCKRRVGTIFSTKNRELVAKCGDKTSPCKLNIRISMGHYDYIPSLLEKINTNINNIKLKISVIKLNLLFGFIKDDEMEKEFLEMKELYKSVLTAKNVVDDFLNSQKITEVEEVGENRKIKRKIVAQNQKIKLSNLVQSFKDLMSEYEKDEGDNKVSIMTEAIELYQEEILPTTKIIREMLYDIQTMIYSRGKFHLVQIPLAMDKMVIDTVKPEIISNIK